MSPPWGLLEEEGRAKKALNKIYNFKSLPMQSIAGPCPLQPICPFACKDWPAEK